MKSEASGRKRAYEVSGKLIVLCKGGLFSRLESWGKKLLDRTLGYHMAIREGVEVVLP